MNKALAIILVLIIVLSSGCISAVSYNRHRESSQRSIIANSGDQNSMRLLHLGIKPSNVIKIQSLNSDNDFAVMANMAGIGSFWEYFKENKGAAIMSLAADAALAYGAYTVGDNNNWFRSSERIEIHIHGNNNEININNSRSDAGSDSKGQ